MATISQKNRERLETLAEKRALEKIDRELNPEYYQWTTKVCTVCGGDKKLIDFPPLENRCIACKSTKNQAKRREDPVHLMWMSTKGRAKKFGREFTITEEDIRAVWTDTCPVLGIPLQMNEGKAGPNSHSIDRINNDLGYVPGNIAIVSNQFNAMKRDLTPEILRRMLAYIEGRLIP